MAVLRRKALSADQRNKTAAFERAYAGGSVGVPLNKLQKLLLGFSDWNQQAASKGKLFRQSLRDARSRSGNNDRIEWREFGKPQ
jgi:hypothetical protein